MHYELLSEIRNIEVIAEGRGVRIKRFWTMDGRIREAEIHWYEAHGIGRKGFKIIRLFPEG